MKAANAILLLSQFSRNVGTFDAMHSDEDDHGFVYSTPPPQGEHLFW